MLASFFVVNGVKTAMKPEALVTSAEPIAQKVVPLAQRLAPPSVAPYIPEDTTTLVRLTGVVQVLGGLGLATGIGRRPGAALLALSMVPHVLASRAPKTATPDEKTTARSLLLRNIALLGAALIAAQDTEGRPSLGWLAHDSSRRLSSAASRGKKSLGKDAEHLAHQTKLRARLAKAQLESAVT